MEFSGLFDATAAMLVVGGTLLATLLRSGPRDCLAAARTLLRSPHGDFDGQRVKSELARQARDIQRDGFLRAAVHQFDDGEFNDIADALIAGRSVDALLAAHEAHRNRRIVQTQLASSTFAQAAELAPVFGLAGTLVSLSQLPAEGLEASAFAGTISLAVLTTLYGLLLANLLLAPLARRIDRISQREEAQRRELVEWLATQVRTLQKAPRQTPEQAPRHTGLSDEDSGTLEAA